MCPLTLTGLTTMPLDPLVDRLLRFNTPFVMARSFALTFSLFLYAALAAGVVGFSSASLPSSFVSLSFPLLLPVVDEDLEFVVAFFFVLTPALDRRGRDLAADTSSSSVLFLPELRELDREEPGLAAGACCLEVVVVVVVVVVVEEVVFAVVEEDALEGGTATPSVLLN